MLSINIPVYNVEVYDLVLTLFQQAQYLNVPFEIRVYDDGSEEKIKATNREVKSISNVIYFELKENVGRAAIRNQMGMDSGFENLLFLDADSKVVSNKYLENYLFNRKQNCVLCGGTAYEKEKPKDSKKLLRWVYGTNREAVSAKIRNHQKGFIITSNNFMIEKRVFEKIHFREDIKNYGHEDTVLGFDLFRQGIEIFHIDNPLEHTGLEDAETFLEKTKTALKNLSFISNDLLRNDKDFIQQVYFLNRYSEITRSFPAFFFRLFYKTCRRFLEVNLKGKNPRMFWFDLYKVGYYSTITK